jgi:hypothetical protein
LVLESFESLFGACEGWKSLGCVFDVSKGKAEVDFENRLLELLVVGEVVEVMVARVPRLSSSGEKLRLSDDITEDEDVRAGEATSVEPTSEGEDEDIEDADEAFLEAVSNWYCWCC